MSLATQTAKTKTKSNPNRKPQSKPTIEKQAIVPTAIYSRVEVAQLTGLHLITVIRAYSNGFLKVSRVGSRVLVRGQAILDWLEAGGNTGNFADPDYVKPHAKMSKAKKSQQK